MTFAKVQSCALIGINTVPVTVEVHVSNGLPCLSIVGLPEASVRESKDRVRAAIINSNFEFPARRITINLAPADLPKEGARLDLAIALGILAASNQIPLSALNGYEFHGELGLAGDLRHVSGALPIALSARSKNITLVLPESSAQQAALVTQCKIYQASHLLEVCQHLHQQGELPLAKAVAEIKTKHSLCMSEVNGQAHAKRAFEIAASGSHNLLMIGPPGSGKTMLASRLAGILPPMTESQALEAAAIKSICHTSFSFDDWKHRSFRAPHHTASGVALVGGGSIPRPGEISLSHHGVLFLDELTEFNRHTLDVLREPMETGKIIISRAARQAEFPARFQLIAAMNPCPQGYNCDGKDLCQCTAQQQLKHRSGISAPLLDRIDMHIEVPRVSHKHLKTRHDKNETSENIQSRVCHAYKRQIDRQGKANAELSNREIEQLCSLSKSDEQLLDNIVEKLKLSARAYHRIIKLSRTIADLDDENNIKSKHLTEAISYRTLDRLLNK